MEMFFLSVMIVGAAMLVLLFIVSEKLNFAKEKEYFYAFLILSVITVAGIAYNLDIKNAGQCILNLILFTLFGTLAKANYEKMKRRQRG